MTLNESSPKLQKSQVTRTCLIKAARKKFTEDGFANTSLNTIVEEAGVTKGALFHHFKDKIALFYEVWLELENEMNDEANKVAIEASKAAGREKPYAGFIAGCGVYFDYAARNDYRRIVMVDGTSILGDYEWRRLDAAMGFITIGEGLRALYGMGAIRTPPTKALIVMIQGAVYGAAHAIARGEEGIHKEDLLFRIESTLRVL